MLKHTTIFFLFILFFSVSLIAEENNSKAREIRPNILLVISDDHSYPHVGVYGDPNVKTPNLDRFASEGITFRRAYVTAPQCVQSRAGIFAARSQVGIGMSRFSAPFPAEIKSFPEYLRDAGFYTGLAGRPYHMEGEDGLGAPVRQADGTYEYKRFGNRYDYAKSAPGQGLTGISNTLKQFSEFLDLVPEEKPFFLQLCFHDPHAPYDNEEIPDPTNPDKLVLPSWCPDIPLIRKAHADYYNEVNRFDQSFGKVLAELDKRSLKENTLVIFIGDNGASILRGKGSLYESGIHVPLLVRWTGKILPGSVSSELISGEDIGSTCLAVAGITPPIEWTSRSFLPILFGEKEIYVRNYVFAARGAHGFGLPTGIPSFDLSRTIVGQRYKLIYNPLWQIPYIFYNGGPNWVEIQNAAKAGKVLPSIASFYTGEHRAMFELYDLQNDPDELENLSGKKETATIELQLKRELRNWMIGERDFVPLPLQREQPNVIQKK
ncbi:MAG: sulfatase [Planctomycetaceae bacterium]|jgi:arylsulfatase A-like enzyme|nr:sulfatase [Planctomycetaceae bacterium]